MEIDVNGVKITLTAKQKAKIPKERKFNDFRDIKTFENVCQALPDEYKAIKKIEKVISKNAFNFMLLELIIKAINPKGYSPNWEDTKYKYWNYFNMRDGFSLLSMAILSRMFRRPFASLMKKEQNMLPKHFLNFTKRYISQLNKFGRFINNTWANQYMSVKQAIEIEVLRRIRTNIWI